MNRDKEFSLPLAARLTLAMTLLVILSVAAVTLLSLRREQRTYEQELEAQAHLLLDTLAIQVANPLFRLDANTLREIAEDLKQAEVIASGRIYDAEGRVIADTEAEEELVFSLEPDEFGAQLVAAEDPIVVRQPDQLIVGHPITAGNRVIGAISIGLSTDPLQQKIAATRNQGALTALGAAGAGIVLALLISRGITNPINQLTTATEKLAGGDFSQQIELHTGDELTVLAHAFNSMATRIQKQVADLEQRSKEIGSQNEELKRVNRELDVARAKAEDASRIKSEFLAVMSHELRTPLNAINGFAQIILAGMSGELTPKQRENVERILANGEHLLSLINDILDISKIEAGTITLIPKPFLLREWFDQISTQTSSLAEKKKLKTETSLDSKLPDQIVGDQARLRQIAINLISNAVKFTETGEIKVEARQTDDSRWQLIVSDTGPGIPPHAQEYIFEAFRQVDSSTQRTHEGSGLGLAIARNLVRMMQGTINVKSKVGEGSTFTVELPLLVPEPEKQGG